MYIWAYVNINMYICTYMDILYVHIAKCNPKRYWHNAMCKNPTSVEKKGKGEVSVGVRGPSSGPSSRSSFGFHLEEIACCIRLSPSCSFLRFRSTALADTTPEAPSVARQSFFYIFSAFFYFFYMCTLTSFQAALQGSGLDPGWTLQGRDSVHTWSSFRCLFSSFSPQIFEFSCGLRVAVVSVLLVCLGTFRTLGTLPLHHRCLITSILIT